MLIRPATLTDLPTLRAAYAGFCVEQQQTYGGIYPSMDVEELDNFVVAVVRSLPSPVFRCWIAEGHGQEFLGFLGAAIEVRNVSKPHRYGYVHWLWVDPRVRRQGIGKSLARVMLEWYAAEGIEALETHAVAGDNQWMARGWLPIRTHLVAPRVRVHDWATGSVIPDDQRETPRAPAPAPKAPRRKRKPRKVQRVNGEDHAR